LPTRNCSTPAAFNLPVTCTETWVLKLYANPQFAFCNQGALGAKIPQWLGPASYREHREK